MNQESSVHSERLLGLPHPRDFHRLSFSLCYRVKPIAKILANSSQCDSGFVLFFFLLFHLWMSSAHVVSCHFSAMLAASFLPPAFCWLYIACFLSVDPSLKNSLQLHTHFPTAWQNFLKQHYMSASTSALSHFLWSNIQLFMICLVSTNSLLSFSHHCSPCILVELQTFSPPQNHISLCFYSILSSCLSSAWSFPLSHLCTKAHFSGNGSEIYLC